MKILFAHNSKNLVKKGDKVKAYGEYIGAIGNADNQYFSHLHYSASVGLSIAQIKAYVNGWSVEKVKKYYREPDIQNALMFEKPVDNGQAGYDWLQTISNGSPHPGRDYNGFGGGDSDYGYKFKSPVDGEVEFVGDWGSGWGKVIIIEEKTMSEKELYVISDLRNPIESITGKDYHKMDSEKLQKEAGKDLEEYSEKVGKIYRDNTKLAGEVERLKNLKPEIKEVVKKVEVIKEVIKEVEKIVEKNVFRDKPETIKELEKLRAEKKIHGYLIKLLIETKKKLIEIWGMIK